MTGNSSPHSFYGKDFISTKDISLHEIQSILKLAAKFKKNPNQDILSGKIIANCFFEPSTRTRLSFEAAALRLGAKVIGFSSQESLSIQKGETLTDTIQMIASYADLIVLRHPLEGAARFSAEIATCPLINAGDGANQHPTQALLDLFTISECQKELRELSIALVGDLKYGRTVHSLLNVCALFDMRIYLLAPDALSLPDSLCDQLKQRGLRFSFHENLEEIIPKLDILYMTRIQNERINQDNHLYQRHFYLLSKDKLKKAKDNLKILHPLPRLSELPPEIDHSDNAFYFQQAANAVPVRQALLTLLLNESAS